MQQTNLKISLSCGVLGALGAAVIWFVMPRNSELSSIWQLLFKIGVFTLISAAIAYFPNEFRGRALLACVPFVGFLAYILPRISYYGFFVGDILADEKLSGEFYTYLYLLLYPGIILSLCLAFRMGGGSIGDTLKISLIGQLLIFSGFLDIMWPLVNPVGLPETIYGQHIKVFFGRFVTYQEATYFCLAHIPLLLILIWLPLDRWLDRTSSSATVAEISAIPQRFQKRSA